MLIVAKESLKIVTKIFRLLFYSENSFGIFGFFCHYFTKFTVISAYPILL
ncbi:hypothetical protein RV11_GL000589 [Enterococcus phoeniculicola]|nr:hypothetical protein RV11_GL000589 [Enterococcus phoeniculicola]